MADGLPVAIFVVAGAAFGSVLVLSPPVVLGVLRQVREQLLADVVGRQQLLERVEFLRDLRGVLLLCCAITSKVAVGVSVNPVPLLVTVPIRCRGC